MFDLNNDAIQAVLQSASSLNSLKRTLMLGYAMTDMQEDVGKCLSAIDRLLIEHDKLRYHLEQISLLHNELGLQIGLLELKHQIDKPLEF